MRRLFINSRTIKHLSFLGSLLIMFSLFGAACKQKSSASVQQEMGKPETSVSGVSSEMTESIAPDTFLYYKRTPCFGMCAIFDMTVLENGDVTYSGKNFTNLIGDYRTHIDKTTLQNILSKAESIEYFRMSEVYDNPGVTDLPSIYLAIRKDKNLKWVKNRYNGPKELRVLYEYLDQIIADAKWEAIKQ